MVKLLTHALSLGALLALATACSKQDAPTPAAGTRTAGANNVAPIDPPPGGGGGGGSDPSCTPAPPAQDVKDRIKASAQKICRTNRWTIVTTITPPDGFTYGLGCPSTSYPFSVDIIDENGTSTYASGTYSGGTVTLSK